MFTGHQSFNKPVYKEKMCKQLGVVKGAIDSLGLMGACEEILKAVLQIATVLCVRATF